MSNPVTPTAAPATQHFQTPPEMLIKKHVPKAEAPAPDPEVAAADEASFAEMKEKLPSILWGDKPKAAEPAPAAPAVAVAPAAVAPAEPAEPADPPRRTVVRKQLDPVEIARSAAMEAARAIAQERPAAPAPAAPAAPDLTAHLDSKDKENYELFKHLSDSDPTQYKDAHTRFLGFVDKLDGYKRRWQKANPGQEFDAEDAEHENFYAANQPQFNPKDLEVARIRVEANKEVERRMSATERKYQERFEELESKAISGEVQREAAVHAGTATSVVVASMEDPAVKALLEKNPDDLKASDPVAYEVLDQSVAQLQEQVVELHNIIRRPRYFNQSNPVHNYVSNFVNQQEARIAALPVQNQIHEGRMFATREQMSQVPPAQRNRYWTLQEDDIVHMLASDTAARVNRSIGAERKRIEQMAVRYGYTRTGAAAAAPQPAGSAPAPAAAPASRKPASPSAGGGEGLAPAGTPAPKGAEPVEKKLVGMLF